MGNCGPFEAKKYAVIHIVKKLKHKKKCLQSKMLNNNLRFDV